MGCTPGTQVSCRKSPCFGSFRSVLAAEFVISFLRGEGVNSSLSFLFSGAEG